MVLGDSFLITNGCSRSLCWICGVGGAYAGDRDVVAAIAICRALRGEVDTQFNQILDIEEKRH